MLPGEQGRPAGSMEPQWWGEVPTPEWARCFAAETVDMEEA